MRYAFSKKRRMTLKRKLFREKVKNRGGFSIVEVVVGLTVVVMVTIVALSVTLASVQMEAKYLNETTALCACESVVACVRFADNTDELQDALEKLAVDGSVDDPVAGEYSFQQNTVRVSVVFDSNFTNFEITAKTMSGEEIQQVQYEKN